MQFTARIRLNSYIDKAWRGANKLGGRVHDVAFKRRGLYYVSEVLQGHEVEALRHHIAVELQSFGKLAEAVVKEMKAPTPTQTGTVKAPEEVSKAPATTTTKAPEASSSPSPTKD